MTHNTSINVVNTSTFEYSRAYGLQDALYDFGAPDGIPTLYETGCVQSDNHTLNCALSCLDVDAIFGNMSTLQNCLVYPVISSLISNETLESNATQVANRFGIYANSTTLPEEISTIIQKCFTSYCKISKGCMTPPEDDIDNGDDDDVYPTTCWSYENEYSETSTKFCFNHTNICDTTPFPVISDIAGIGVYISYLMQGGIALSAFLLLKFFQFWLYYICIAITCWPCGYRVAKEKAQVMHTQAARCAIPRLLSALTDFQKAQCYFMMAVQIATQITLGRGDLQPNSLQQLFNSLDVCKTIAINGFLPITFTLLCLHTAGTKSGYLLLLSIIAISVSAATLYKVPNVEPRSSDYAYLDTIVGDIPDCGIRNPTTYCYDDGGFADAQLGTSGPNIICIFSLIILGLLILDFLNVHKTRQFKVVLTYPSHRLSRRDPHQERERPWRRHGTSALDFFARNQTKIVNTVFLVVWAVYLFWFAHSFRYFGNLLSVVNVSNWGFGQIVGITVWTEPVVEYIYLEIVGLKRGLQYRTPAPYKVISVHDDEGVVAEENQERSNDRELSLSKEDYDAVQQCFIDTPVDSDPYAAPEQIYRGHLADDR